jgi:hypothetical protein
MPWIKRANLRGPVGQAGPRGFDGLPGVNGVENDEAVAAYVATPTSETSKTLSELFLDFRRIFKNIASFAYGMSWIRYENGAGPTYPNRVASLFGMQALVNRATGGNRMQDTATDAYGTSALSWVAGTKGVVIVGDLLNNLGEPDDARNRATALESARALCALLSASSRIEQDSATFTYTGAWPAATVADDYSGGSIAYVNPNLNAGVEATLYVEMALAANVDYYFKSEATTTSVHGAVLRFYDVTGGGSTVIGELDLHAKAYLTANKPALGRAPIVFRIPRASTARTIRVKITTQAGYSGTCAAFIDALLPQSSTPPLLIWVKPLPVLAASHNKPALRDYLRTIPDTLAAEFKNVLVVDPLDGWDMNTMLISDGLHPNNLGQQHNADAVANELIQAFIRKNREAAFGVLS